MPSPDLSFPPFQLRLARLDEVPALEALITRSTRELQSAHYTPAQLDGALGTVFGVDRQLIRDGTYFVAEHDGDLAGCGGWSRRKTLFGPDHGRVGEDPLLDPATEPARIRAFFVHPQFARRGVGSLIMRAAEDAIIAAGFRHIEIAATLAGVPMYEKFGYTTFGRHELTLPNGEPILFMKMARTLPGHDTPPAAPL